MQRIESNNVGKTNMSEPLFKTDSSASADKYHNTAARDRISQLPDDILRLIIRHLSLRDAVKTSVLSHRWKHVHSYMSVLDFSLSSMFPHRKCHSTRNRKYIVKAVNKFLEFYQGFLEFYQGPPITLFKVAFCFECDFTDDIDRWLGFAIRMGAKRISLQSSCAKHFDAPPERKYVLRKEVFDGGSRINLRKLYLFGCVLGPDFTNQFSSIERLTLVSVPLANYDLMSLFSCLVNLKTLELEKCTLPVNLSLSLLTRLKSLRIVDCVGMKNIELPDVKALKLEGFSPRLVKLKSHKVEAINYLSVTDGQLHDIFSHPPRQVTNLKALYVRTKSEWCKQIPQKLGIFSRVISIRLLFCESTNFDILKMVSILEAFPSLRICFLMISCPADAERTELSHRNYVHKYLEYVTISGFYDTPNQIRFAIYLLKHAPGLEELVIRQERSNLVAKRQSWDEGERRNILRKLHKFDKNRVTRIQG